MRDDRLPDELCVALLRVYVQRLAATGGLAPAPAAPSLQVYLGCFVSRWFSLLLDIQVLVDILLSCAWSSWDGQQCE